MGGRPSPNDGFWRRLKSNSTISLFGGTNFKTNRDFKLKDSESNKDDNESEVTLVPQYVLSLL